MRIADRMASKPRRVRPRTLSMDHHLDNIPSRCEQQQQQQQQLPQPAHAGGWLCHGANLSPDDALEVIHSSAMGMDAMMWGTLLWNLLSAIATRLDAASDKADAVAAFEQLAYSLRYVLPCSYCRQSYREYVSRLPPPDGSDESDDAAISYDDGDDGEKWDGERSTGGGVSGSDSGAEEAACSDEAHLHPALAWVWRMHNLVNGKLRRPDPLTLEKFVKRSRVWTSFIYPQQLWDLVLILALNYPKRDTEERDEKRSGYRVFFRALAALCALDPWLESVGAFLAPAGDSDDGRCDGTGCSWRPRSQDEWSSRAAFIGWVSQMRMRWARSQGMSVEQLRALKSSRTELVRYAASETLLDVRREQQRDAKKKDNGKEDEEKKEKTKKKTQKAKKFATERKKKKKKNKKKNGEEAVRRKSRGGRGGE
jgi:hypothetical protein